MIIIYYPHISLLYTYMHMRLARAFIDSRNKLISHQGVDHTPLQDSSVVYHDKYRYIFAGGSESQYAQYA